MSTDGAPRVYGLDGPQHVSGCQCGPCLKQPGYPQRTLSRRHTFIIWAGAVGLNLLLTFVVLGDTSPTATVVQLADARSILYVSACLSVAAFACILSLLWHLLDRDQALNSGG